MPERYEVTADCYLLVCYHPSDIAEIFAYDPIELDAKGRHRSRRMQGLRLRFDADIPPGYPYLPPREDIARILALHAYA